MMPKILIGILYMLCIVVFLLAFFATLYNEKNARKLAEKNKSAINYFPKNYEMKRLYRKVLASFFVVGMILGICVFTSEMFKFIISDSTNDEKNIVTSRDNNNSNFEKENNNVDLQTNPYMEYSPLDISYTKFYSEWIDDVIRAGIDLTSDTTLSMDELQLLRNLIFARQGHDFKNENLAEFFSNEEWYEKIEGKEVGLSDLSADEQKALSIIDAKIKEIKNVEASLPKYKYDSTKDLVYVFYETENVYTGKTVTLMYINIDNEKMRQINEQLYDWAYWSSLGELNILRCEYYLNGDILTFIAERDLEYGGEEGIHFNINIETGEFVGNATYMKENGIQIGNIKNLGEKIFNSKVAFSKVDVETPEQYFTEYLRVDSYSDKIEVYKTIDDAEKWKLIYIDKEQKIHVIFGAENWAGATGVDIFIDCIVEF